MKKYYVYSPGYPLKKYRTGCIVVGICILVQLSLAFIVFFMGVKYNPDDMSGPICLALFSIFRFFIN